METKKCPMCAEEIPLTAVTCEYCDAQFEVTSTGYCQNCHQVREANGNGQCKVCGNSVVDFRVGSRFIEEAMQEPIPISQPIAQTEIPKSEKRHVPFGVLGFGLTLVAAGSFLLFGRNDIPAVVSFFASDTPTATITFTPTSTFTPTLTPTATLTRTPRPTPTATPDRRILNPANQHLYLYVKIQKTWHEARDYCAMRGGHLVTIQAPSENKFVYELAVSGNTEFGTWLGGTDEEKEGTWKWVTGEDWRYQSWRRNNVETEPDNDFADEIPNADYLRFDGWDSTWKDTHLEEFYFVCEWEP